MYIYKCLPLHVCEMLKTLIFQRQGDFCSNYQLKNVLQRKLLSAIVMLLPFKLFKRRLLQYFTCHINPSI